MQEESRCQTPEPVHAQALARGEARRVSSKTFAVGSTGIAHLQSVTRTGLGLFRQCLPCLGIEKGMEGQCQPLLRGLFVQGAFKQPGCRADDVAQALVGLRALPLRATFHCLP
ncbi:hypothetical protein XFF6166_920113 [Xanthomonas citri pv. fuscans]|nr:hypothetical protein XFF6166_920113 [Xanthomonas citri pv. fuscans]SOO03688.1 hypothetical protein XFF6960_890004 [Xanthomonas citri pv. fuscans]SOO04936.1 hypothetical protein XFF7767_340004 [Xanthomonas citri pv. fuscans]SOO11592.1 hypothetical protein XFF6970_90060 [Xanthomonas citri pv. fuscans]SOO12757.1 hypothetical protein XFF7766_1130114 [Xanthomonas citri pv. fuscans]